MHLAVSEMLKDTKGIEDYIFIESDNCSAQYKSSAHIHTMQELENEYNTKIIRIYGIAEHWEVR